MKKASWIVLALVGSAIFLVSLLSTSLAYRSDADYGIGNTNVSKLAATDASVATALRGIRATSAAFAAAYAVLFLAIVLGPYRKGEVWAWYALLAAGIVQLVIVVLRVPLLGTQLGISASITQMVPLVIGLLLDVGRLSGRK